MTSSHRARPLAALVCSATLLLAAAAQSRRAADEFTTEQIVAAAGIRENRTVCEMGAGSGSLTLAASRIVGPGGRVYTSELGDERVAALRKSVTSSERPRITVVEGAATATNFPDAACDALFMRNVYHHFADPAAMAASIWQAVAPGGRVVVVDFTPRGGEEAARPEDRSEGQAHGVTPESVARELTGAGFTIVSSERRRDRSLMVVASKPA